MSEGVWHMSQWILLKSAWPFWTDEALGFPGIPWAEGAGGARNRMKVEKATISLTIAAPDRSKFVPSSGVGFNWQEMGTAPRSLGKASFVTPISTL